MVQEVSVSVVVEDLRRRRVSDARSSDLIQGVGLRVWGLGFGVEGLGCRVWGLGFVVGGLGFGM